MILVDTSIWIDHLRETDLALSDLLERRQILTHPFVIGEVALGSLKQRDLILASLRCLPGALVGTDEEVHAYIDQHALFGVGIGYVDAHLLTATSLTLGAQLWTRDKRLRGAAVRLGIDANMDG